MKPVLKTAVLAGLWAALIGPLFGSILASVTGSDFKFGSVIISALFMTGYALVMFGPAGFCLGFLVGLPIHWVVQLRLRFVAVLIALILSSAAGGAAAWVTTVLYGWDLEMVRSYTILGAISGAVCGGTFACWRTYVIQRG